MEHRIILVGCGTVGRGLLEILQRKAAALRDDLGFEAKVVAATDQVKGTVIEPRGIDPATLLARLDKGQPLSGDAKAPTLDPLEVIEQVDADIMAEMTFTNLETGEPATSYVRKALRTGKSVVTSNKGPAALHYRELADLARQNKRHFRIEGTVMSGTPVFHLAEAGLAGNAVAEVQGILNGTTNFILTKMETEGMAYADALAMAQKLGYAEADPTGDVEGFDAMGKVIILANVLMGGKVKAADVKRTGITGISLEMVRAAQKEGARYKLIGSARRAEGGAIEASVAPRKLPLSDPLAGVMGARNALTFDTDLMGKVTIQGAGAGRIETGYAILSDMLAIHRLVC